MKKRASCFRLFCFLVLIADAQADSLLAPFSHNPREEVEINKREVFSKFGEPPTKLCLKDECIKAKKNKNESLKAQLISSVERAPLSVPLSSKENRFSSNNNHLKSVHLDLLEGSESTFKELKRDTETHPEMNSENILDFPIKTIFNKVGLQEAALISGDAGFFPKTIFVTKNIPVKLYITGASKKTLCFMLDDFEIRRQVRFGKIEEVSFYPSKVGRYRFYCPMNGLEGVLFVKELPSSLLSTQKEN